MPGANTNPITVAVIHAEELVRVGVCATLEREPDFRVVYAGERLDELALAVETGQVPMPRVVLLLVTPPLDPICAAMRRWRKQHGTAALVVIGALTPLIVQRVLVEGALGTLACGVSCAEVVQSLRTAAAGAPYANTWLLQHLRRGARPLRASQRDGFEGVTGGSDNAGGVRPKLRKTLINAAPAFEDGHSRPSRRRGELRESRLSSE